MRTRALGLFGLPGLVLWAVAFVAAPGVAAEPGLAAKEAFFEKHVRPLLVERCYACHAGEKAGGGLSLETRDGWAAGGDSGPAIVAGDADASLLVQAVRGDDPSWRMPPEDSGPPLTPEEVAVLTQWVADGAVDPRTRAAAIGGMTLDEARTWWAFADLPEADAVSGPERIDGLLEDALAAAGLTAVGPADDRTLIRRVTYDLTGLPPTPAEVEAFVADASPDKFTHLIDRLLDSPQYGVRYGRHWLDVVRYADTAGENTDRPLPHAWRYRNWVFDAFQRDMPYDEFVRLQLAGDLVRAGESQEQLNEGIVATGYLAIARRFGHDIHKDRHLTHEDVIDNVGKAFLGLTTGCARCHDHKYDPVSSADYYALYGMLESTRFAFPGCEPQGEPKDLVPLVSVEEIEAAREPWLAAKATYDEAVARRQQAVSRSSLAAAAGATSVELAAALVGEGAEVPLLGGDGAAIDVTMKQGEVLQLTVLPNGNHGADTTRVDWSIERMTADDAAAVRWSTTDLIDDFATGSFRESAEAGWCLLEENAEGPGFLTTFEASPGGIEPLEAWSDGDTPSVCVNPTNEPVAAWTTLPPRSFFVHPGEGHPVAVAWICPCDGRYLVSGTVADAHPAGLDGVSFQLTHRPSAAFGQALSAAGRVVAAPLPAEPGPEPTFPVAYAVIDAEPTNVAVHLRGDPEQLGDEVPRRWLSVFGGQRVAADAGSGRAELAEWILAEPLAARVIVNRLWQWHFGRGLVASANDFGARGEPPTHPELLDWLAARFLAEGGRLKPMHRLIMQTQAYRRASAAPVELIATDPDNRWLARFSRRRLTAEEIRDSLLAVSGTLDPSPGEAHPFPPEATWGFTQHGPFTAIYPTDKRSAFVMRPRQRQHPFFALFDGADPNASTPSRDTTTVPTQALYFLNDPFFHEQAAAFATRVVAEASAVGEPERQAEAVIDRAFSLAYSREASDDEIAVLTAIVGNPASTDPGEWEGLARVILATSEFLHVD